MKIYRNTYIRGSFNTFFLDQISVNSRFKVQMATINMNDIQVVDSNNRDQKQTDTDQVVMHQPLSVSIYVNTGYISNPDESQRVPIDQNGDNAPVIVSNGTNIDNTMALQITGIPEYRTWSIFNILCCCVILGGFAFMKSRETREKKHFGNFQDALKASKSAKILNVSATVIGIIYIIITSIRLFTESIQLP